MTTNNNFNPSNAAAVFFGNVQTGIGEVARGVEDAACNAWKAVLPPPLQQALRASQMEPWRSVQRAVSFTAPSLLPYAVMPFTFPLTLFFYPLIIWLETARITFAVLANCMRVTTTIQNEATDLLRLIDAFGPSTLPGRTARLALNAAGAGVVVELYDQIAAPAKAVLVDVKAGRPINLGAALHLAQVAIVASGDADLLATYQATGEQIDALETALTSELAEVGALASTAVVSSPLVITDIAVTKPSIVKQLRTVDEKSNGAAYAGIALAVAAVAGGAIYLKGKN